MRNGWDFAGLGTSALYLVGVAVFASGCKVYKQSWDEQQMAGAPAQTAAGRSGGAGKPAPTAGAAGMDPSPPPVVRNMCDSGECWWSKGTTDDCRSASMPLPGDRPTGADESTTLGEIYLGLSEVRLGTEVEGELSEDAWEGLGFDLDGLCTNSDTCVETQESCHSPGPAIPYDGRLCRDNTFGRLQPVIAAVPGLGEKFGLTENMFNCQLKRGGYNMIVRISNYNGLLDDPRVRVDYYLSTGLEEAPAWRCPVADLASYPRWRSARTWMVEESTLREPIDEPGKLPDSTTADADAYVREGYLVARVPTGTEHGFIGDGNPHRGFVFRVQQGVFVGRLSREQDGTWAIRDGLLGGRVRKDDLVRSFREAGFCEKGEVNTFYQSMIEFLDETADMLASGEVDASAECDAVSYGIGFSANQLTPGKAVKAPARVECCAPGANLEECLARCGDGQINGDEKCDMAIPSGEPGACPTVCPNSDTCVPQTLSGNGCSSECKEVPITMGGPEDGCCPRGATVASDPDCKAQCGNGAIEVGETCEPPGSCMQCQESPCFQVRTTGSPETCNVRCEITPIETCQGGDRCCPSGCNSGMDSDCSTSCGNGSLEQTETCDNSVQNRQCPSDCSDNDPCTKDLRSGSAANCSVRCLHVPITEALNGDGCCPPEANANTDDSCRPTCGNGAVEMGEQCDDGNTDAGDRCIGCRLESDLQVCLMTIGAEDDCARCECAHCAMQVEGCYGASAAGDACSDLVHCSREENCGNPDCYCGTASLFGCFAGAGNGDCKRETEVAARSESIFEIESRSADLNFPLGRANALFTCVERYCQADCPTP